MKRIKKWLSKPITWGGWLKLLGIGYGITSVISVIYICVTIKPTWLKGLTTKLFRKKKIKSDVI